MDVISFAEVWHKKHPEGCELKVNEAWRSLNILREEDLVTLADDLVSHNFTTAILVARLPANGDFFYDASYLLGNEFSKKYGRVVIPKAIRIGIKRRLLDFDRDHPDQVNLTDYGRVLQGYVSKRLQVNYSIAG